MQNKLNSLQNNNQNNTGKKYRYAIHFISTNNDINYPMVCDENDLICRLEEELYREFPRYKEYNTFLTCKGTTLNRFKTIKENNIQKGDSIIVNIIE